VQRSFCKKGFFLFCVYHTRVWIISVFQGAPVHRSDPQARLWCTSTSRDVFLSRSRAETIQDREDLLMNRSGIRCRYSMLALSVMLWAACSNDEQSIYAPVANEEGQQNQLSAPSVATSTVGMPGAAKMSGEPVQVPYITWGGDYPFFWCTGGLQTRENTLCAQYKTNVKLVPGDNFQAQLSDYKAGKSPFLRGTFEMVGVHTVELCGNDANACPEFVFQMTWSAGDHLVTREGITDLSQLKGKTVAVQKGGPHMGFLFAILQDAGLKWSDVKIMWVDNLSGVGSPAEALQKNPSVDGAFVITPDMLALTGAESTVKGAHLLVSTKERRRTIADAYFVRRDWAQAHEEDLRNFVAAYLYSMEAVKALQEAYDGSGSTEYKALMSFASQVLSAVPTFEDADGLYRDATFVGHSGAVAFLDAQNKEGISTFVTRSNAIARELGLANSDFQINVAPVDLSHAVFNALKTKGLARKTAFNAEATRAQLEQMTSQGTIGKNKSLSFSAGYAPNQTTFDASQYKAEFDRILELMGSYSTAPVAIRCHADTLIAVGSMLHTGMEAGVISRQGTSGNYSYYVDGAPLDITNASKMGGLIHDPRFNQAKKADGQSPTEIAGAAKTLTEERCRNARDSFLTYAKSKGSKVSETQVVAQGVGIAEPVVVLPRSEKETAANRRVEFSVVRVEVEASNPSFDY